MNTNEGRKVNQVATTAPSMPARTRASVPSAAFVHPPTNPTNATSMMSGPGVVSPSARPSIICAMRRPAEPVHRALDHVREHRVGAAEGHQGSLREEACHVREVAFRSEGVDEPGEGQHPEHESRGCYRDQSPGRGNGMRWRRSGVVDQAREVRRTGAVHPVRGARSVAPARHAEQSGAGDHQGKGADSTASATNAASAMATWKGWRRAREPMRMVAAITIATTAGFTPARIAAATGVVPNAM